MVEDQRLILKFRRMLGGILIAAVWSLWAGAGFADQEAFPAAVDSLYRRALSTLNDDSVRATAERLKGAVSGYPHRAELLTRIGLLYLRAGEADSARAAFERAIEQDPGLVAAHFGLGRVYLELQDDPKGALPHLQVAAAADSTYADAHYFLARTYLKMGRMEARREADRAIRYDPNYAPAYLLLAQAYQKDANLRLAILYYKKYLEQEPADQASAYEFALDLLNQGRIKEAEEVASLMIDNRGLPVLAQALMHWGDYDRAMSAFDLYIASLDPKEQELYLDISLVGLPQDVEAYQATPPEKRAAFLQSFWLRRDPFKATGGAMRRAEHCRRVWYSRTYYGQKKRPWDRRGEVYIRYGEPDYRSTYEQPNAKTSAKVQRVQDALAVQLYGASGLGVTFVGPVFPIRTDIGQVMEPNEAQKNLATSRDPTTTAPNFSSDPTASPENAMSAPEFTSGVKIDPEFAIGLSRWKPVVVGNNWAAVPWEVWVYGDVGKGLEVAFTDEFRSGVYDYAPIPGLDKEDLKRLDEDRYVGQAAYLRLVQRLTELSPSARMAKVTQEEPEHYDLSQFKPLDFNYDVVSFRGQNGLTDVQVNLGIPIDRLSLPEETDTTAMVDRRVTLINSQYTKLLPAQRDLEVPISKRTRGQTLLDRVIMEASPGDYDLAVQAGRRNTHLLQSYQVHLSLPSYAGGKLGLSDLFIAKHVTAADTAPDPKFVRGKWSITPLPSHVFQAGQHVFVYFEVYNLIQNGSGTTRYEVAYQVRATGTEGIRKSLLMTKIVGQSGEAVAVRYERVGTQASVSDYVELDVGQAEPGYYAVQMMVKDLNSGQEVSKKGMFWITD